MQSRADWIGSRYFDYQIVGMDILAIRKNVYYDSFNRKENYPNTGSAAY